MLYLYVDRFIANFKIIEAFIEGGAEQNAYYNLGNQQDKCAMVRL
jgi:hypothetical protein